jgi:hypothetical protein
MITILKNKSMLLNKKIRVQTRKLAGCKVSRQNRSSKLTKSKLLK